MPLQTSRIIYSYRNLQNIDSCSPRYFYCCVAHIYWNVHPSYSRVCSATPQKLLYYQGKITIVTLGLLPAYIVLRRSMPELHRGAAQVPWQESPVLPSCVTPIVWSREEQEKEGGRGRVETLEGVGDSVCVYAHIDICGYNVNIHTHLLLL